MNVFSFTGNLGRDAETRHTQNGNAVCGFPVAAKAGYGDNEQTVWIDCSLWGKRAEGGLVQHLTKGQQVAVHGELSTREHEGKTYLQCRVNDVTLVGGKGGGQQAPQQAQPGYGGQQQAAPAGVEQDDVPF